MLRAFGTECLRVPVPSLSCRASSSIMGGTRRYTELALHPILSLVPLPMSFLLCSCDRADLFRVDSSCIEEGVRCVCVCESHR